MVFGFFFLNFFPTIFQWFKKKFLIIFMFAIYIISLIFMLAFYFFPYIKSKRIIF